MDHNSYNSVGTVKVNFKGITTGYTGTLNALGTTCPTHNCYINVHATTSHNHYLVCQEYQCRIIEHPLHYRHRHYLKQYGWFFCLSRPSSCWFPPLCRPDLFLGPAFPVVVPRCLACVMIPSRSAMMRIPFHVSYTVLLEFRVMVMLRFLPCAQVFLAFASPPLIVRPQPAP
jgi:hypothetical protein